MLIVKVKLHPPKDFLRITSDADCLIFSVDVSKVCPSSIDPLTNRFSQTLQI